MKKFLLLFFIATASARILNQNDCEEIIIDGTMHEKNVLIENVRKPYQMAIDYNTNVLYFSYTTDSKEVFALGYLNLKTNVFGTISGVNGPFANGVDEKSNTVYFGGTDGIYKLEPDTNLAVKLQITDKNIWQIFVKDDLYFTTYPNEEAYVYKNGVVSKLNEIERKSMLIAVDNEHNIIFSNHSGLYYYQKNDGVTTYLGSYTVNAITNDINGKIFFSTPTSGIYSFDSKSMVVKRISTIANIFGVAIESDGSIIYAADNSVIRLQPTGKECANARTPVLNKENDEIQGTGNTIR